MGRPSRAEIICSGIELPTMQHQGFWIEHLLATGAEERDWIFWLAYDDQLRLRGLQDVVKNEYCWPLKHDTAYFGPWAMRHESPDKLWEPTPGEGLETWTSFPISGSTRMRPVDWTLDQLTQPTYIQMSGSVSSLRSHLGLIRDFPRKSGPMRIEIATALDSGTTWVTEFDSALTYIYGRSNSDRSNYARVAAREDRDLIVRLLRRCAFDPRQLRSLFGAKVRRILKQKIRHKTPAEEWRVRRVEID
jgi:hypothetical protein